MMVTTSNFHFHSVQKSSKGSSHRSQQDGTPSAVFLHLVPQLTLEGLRGDKSTRGSDLDLTGEGQMYPAIEVVSAGRI